MKFTAFSLKVVVPIIWFVFLFPVPSLADTVYLPQTGQTATYVPGDDGDLEKGADWPIPRFIDNGDGTITDRLTGLMWLRKNTGPYINKRRDLCAPGDLRHGPAGNLHPGGGERRWKDRP